jgi:hypothetical protein
MPETKKKWLCVCEGGTNRSVALALQLKQAGQDALAGSWRYNSPETFQMLVLWADYVVVMQAEFAPILHEQLGLSHLIGDKMRCVDVGPDVYGSGTHLGLNQFLQGVVAEWRQKSWEL